MDKKTASLRLPVEELKNKDHWIFDLDNTLYSPKTNLFEQIDQRMGQFISELLHVDRPEARRIQKDYFEKYGTTLNGLMFNHHITPESFLEFVHLIDYDIIAPDPALNQALGKLDSEKIVFTNGTQLHAENVLKRLGIEHQFSAIYDIASTGFIPKPQPQAFDRLIENTRLEASSAVMFEDIGRNLEVPHALGMTTVLVRGEGLHPDRDLNLFGTGKEPYIDYITEDLAEFLNVLTADKKD